MELKIQAIHFDTTEKLNLFIEKKAAKLQKNCENIIKASTELSIFSDAFTFALLIIILVFKPTGLFGEKATDKV